MKTQLVLLFWGCLVVAACRHEALIEPSEKPLLFVPSGFPQPDFPSDNGFTAERFALGKRLFYDVVMSVDSSISCASCHSLAHAFSDTVAFSVGASGAAGTRNAPTLANVAYLPYFTREGGVPTLEMQVGVPIQEHNEFNFNVLLIAERLKTDSIYLQMSQAAYSRLLDPFVITRSLACFERCLISGESRFDTDKLTKSERRGKVLFFSARTHCANCHGGFNFTNYAFENNGLYENYADPGRFRLTGIETDRARFKVPTLRNVALTAPYMHDGALPTLQAVVAHYNSGGKAHPNKSSLVQPLALSAQERADLVAFLGSLTDEKFITNPNFR